MTSVSSKIKTLDELLKIRSELKKNKLRMVWTNGCYDILHAGHVLYLQQARAAGEALVVGLNSDESIRRVKGPQRPILPEDQRAIVLAALECVDYIIIFPEASPLDIISKLEPDIYAKGGDYTVDTVNQPERRLIESYGGDILLIPGVEGLSTTEIIRRIRES
ncbi:MAG: D-glycero-beta-D-manno-heptose 1-phosphate adenylyltransferase [candidate division KSB1 bacterium]|nr:D-glycero-beta-D-manno-heptose 1-phosphate adenylyltransferase [candidate division KSB1 bacterium]